MSTPLLQFSFNNTNTNTGSVGYSASLSSNACMITSSPCPNGNAYSLYVPTNEGVTLPTFSINSSFSFCTWLNCSVCDTSDRFCFQLAKNSTDLSTNGLQQQPALMMRGGTLCVVNVGWDGGQTENLVPAYTNGLVTEQTKVLWSLQSFLMLVGCMLVSRLTVRLWLCTQMDYVSFPQVQIRTFILRLLQIHTIQSVIVHTRNTIGVQVNMRLQ